MVVDLLGNYPALKSLAALSALFPLAGGNVGVGSFACAPQLRRLCSSRREAYRDVGPTRLGRKAVLSGRSQADPFREIVEAIVSGNAATAIELLDALPQLTKERATQGATRQASRQSFFDQIRHYVYEGDTALHMAAAAFQTRIAKELLARGADVRARNRRGAQPLCYPSWWVRCRTPRRWQMRLRSLRSQLTPCFFLRPTPCPKHAAACCTPKPERFGNGSISSRHELPHDGLYR
jgi:ankyrin repeat protein